MPNSPRTISLAPGGSTGRTDAQKMAKRFYDSAAWKRIRAVVLAEQPLCADCPADRPGLSSHVHHVRELLTHWGARLTRENLVGLCEVCHTARHKRGRSC